jgi:glycerol kinase
MAKSPPFLLAIDQGTTSSRAILFDATATAIAVAQQPTSQNYPQPGWVSQDANEIWTTTVDCCHAVIAQAAISPGKIQAIGIANQRETTILWDARTGDPVAPAIVWQSRQSTPQVDALKSRGLSSAYQAITGLVPDAYFSGTKIAWLLEHEPELRTRAEAGEIKFGTVDSWLMWKLSGGRNHISDAANASRTMLFDIRTLDWSDRLLADLGIPPQMLPAIVPNSGLLFETDPTVLGRGIPVAGSAGDQQAALFGQACFAPGEAKNTYGTGSFLLMNTGRETITSENRLLSTVAWKRGQEVDYALEGAVFVTGAAVHWLRDGLGIIKSSAEIEQLAASVPDNGGVAFVPALAGLGAPHWDARARGAIVGLTRGTSAAHIARATLEAIAFQTRDVLDAMAKDAGTQMSELKVDGGAASNDLLMQIQSDLLGIPVIRPANLETTATGAAFLAGLASGIWKDLNDIRRVWQVDRRFEPTISQDERDSRYQTWQRAVERSLNWAID